MEMFVKVFVIALFSLGAIGRILMIGDEREPITKGDAVWGLMFNGALISWLIFLIANYL